MENKEATGRRRSDVCGFAVVGGCRGRCACSGALETVECSRSRGLGQGVLTAGYVMEVGARAAAMGV